MNRESTIRKQTDHDGPSETSAVRIEWLSQWATVADGAGESTLPASQQFVFIETGRGVAEIDGKRWELDAGDCLSAPCGARFFLRLEADTNGMWMALDESFGRSKVMPALFVPGPSFWVDYYKPQVERLWPGPEGRPARARLMGEFQNAKARLGYGCDGAVAAYMFLILATSGPEARLHSRDQDFAPVVAPSTDLDVVMAYRGLVEHRYRSETRTRDYSELMGIGPRVLARACKKVLGISPLKIIHDRIVREARRELIYTDKQITMIGYDLGFHDPAHFSKFFKAQTGCGPMEFRANSRAQAAANPR